MLIDLNKFVKTFHNNKALAHKKPNTNINHVGIELELISPIPRHVFAAFIVLNKLDKWVNVGTDGSIECDEDEDDGTEYGLELRILCREKQYKDVMKKLLTLCIKLKCRVNESCGLHVHLDMRKRNYIKCFSNLYRCQSILYSSAASYRQATGYCDSITPNCYYQFNEYLTNYKYFNQAFQTFRAGININSIRKHNTIEIRIHESTLSFNKIESWVDLLIDIVNYKKEIIDGKSWYNWYKERTVA